MSKRDELNDQQERVIGLLLTGKTQREAADEVGVARETVSRWHNEPVFVATLNVRRQELWHANRGRLVSLHGRAVEVMGDLLESDDEAIRFRAAVAVLEKIADHSAPTGPTTPEDVEEDKELAQIREKHRRESARLFASLGA